MHSWLQERQELKNIAVEGPWKSRLCGVNETSSFPSNTLISHGDWKDLFTKYRSAGPQLIHNFTQSLINLILTFFNITFCTICENHKSIDLLQVCHVQCRDLTLMSLVCDLILFFKTVRVSTLSTLLPSRPTIPCVQLLHQKVAVWLRSAVVAAASTLFLSVRLFFSGWEKEAQEFWFPFCALWNSLGKEAPLHLWLSVVAEVISFLQTLCLCESLCVSCCSVQLCLKVRSFLKYWCIKSLILKCKKF